METVSELYDKFYESDTTAESDVTEASTEGPSISELIECDPAALVEFDEGNENSIQALTDVLIKHLSACDNLVDASYNLLQYVPDRVNSDQHKLWKEEIIPIVLKIVSQDVNARSTLTHAFGSVRDLGIVIQKTSEIVHQTRGSPKALEIAKKNIPAALAELELFIEKAKTFDASAINSFASSSEKLFDVIGVKAADFVTRQQAIVNQQEKLYEAENKLWDDYIKTIGEANRYCNLYNANRKHLSDVEDVNQATKLRILDLELKNQSSETKIEDIETKTIDSVTVKRRLLSYRKTKKTTFYEMSQNPDRDAERKYYEGLILGRMARLDMHKNNDETNKKRIDELTAILADYRTNYFSAFKRAERMLKEMPKKIEENRIQIDKKNQELRELGEEQTRIEKKIGLSGSSLMECLFFIKQYSKEIGDGSNAYAPLVSILKGIKKMVESDVQLLSGSASDVFIAGQRLTKFVGFMTKYNISSLPILELSRKTQQLSVADSEANVEK